MIATIVLFAYPLWVLPIVLLLCLRGPRWFAAGGNPLVSATILSGISTLFFSPAFVAPQGFGWPGPALFALLDWRDTKLFWPLNAAFFLFCFWVSFVSAKNPPRAKEASGA